MPSFIRPPIPQSSHFKNAIEVYNKSLASPSFSKLLPITAVSSKPEVLAQPNPTITLLGGRLSYVYPKLVTASSIAFQSKTKNCFSYVEESHPQAETLVDKVTKFNLQAKNFNNILPIEAVYEEVETPLSLVNRITTELDLQAILLPTSSSASNTNSRNNPSEQLPIQSSREEKLIRWILTSHNVCGLAVIVLHNFFDICCQKPEERNFINDSLVPRIRYAGFTFSATAGVVYHVAIGMVSGNCLIHRTMEKSIPSFKRLLTRYLWRVQKICTRLNRVDFPQLRQEVNNVKTTAEMVFITRKLVDIARGFITYNGFAKPF